MSLLMLRGVTNELVKVEGSAVTWCLVGGAGPARAPRLAHPEHGLQREIPLKAVSPFLRRYFYGLLVCPSVRLLSICLGAENLHSLGYLVTSY